MLARTSIVRYYPDTSDEAISILRDTMLPKASEQQGFEGALILRSQTHFEQAIIISFWATEEDLLASSPPEEILPSVERLGELIAHVNQETYDVLFQLTGKSSAS